MCSLNVVTDNGRVLGLDGSALNPLTRSFICGKVRRFDEHMYGSDRIAAPLLRTGNKGDGRFRETTWDDALHRVSSELARVRDEHGGEAILPFAYGGSNGRLTHGCVDARLFRRLRASRLLETFCAKPTSSAATGLYGAMPGVALEDYVHAELIIVWGCNPSATGIHLVPIVREAQRRGAKLVVIDPRQIPLAKRADLHLAPRVGTDLPLALALIDWLFTNGRADRPFLAANALGAQRLRARASLWPIARAAQVCNLAERQVEALAALYANSAPAVIRCGWGVERNRNGGSAAAAILSLPAVAGKFGVRGGGFTMSNSRAFGLSSETAVSEPEPATREVNMSQLGRALAELRDPPIRLLFVYNCNPVATAPEQARVIAGLASEHLFSVVYDQVMTDTARYADVVLPATTFLEHRELQNGYGAMRLFDSPPAAKPVGQARPNYEVFLELCDRLGLSKPDDPRTSDELCAAVLDSAQDAQRLRAELAAQGMAAPQVAAPIQMLDTRPLTASGAIELCPQHLDQQTPAGLYTFQPDPATPDYPLALISPAPSHTVSSTFGQLRQRQARAEIHPTDAASRGISTGSTVRVFNAHTQVLCLARVTDAIRPGTVALPKGLWRKHTANGLTANALCPDGEADLGRGACYNDARVQVARFLSTTAPEPLSSSRESSR